MAANSGVAEPDSKSQAAPGFRRNLALLFAIDAYDVVPRLATPVRDATEIARILRELHGYETRLFLDAAASLTGMRDCLRDLPFELNGEDRVFVYFAGHGVALPARDGPQGYLLPFGAEREEVATFLPMTEFYAALNRLPCRHLLVILDCCFAGTFRWSSTRDLELVTERLHLERYNWFVSGRAWQAIASAAHDQKALDVVEGEPLGERGAAGSHSPFAAALISGLKGDADLAARDAEPDGVITATELYIYLENAFAPPDDALYRRQTPIFWPFGRHERGQYVFLAPNREFTLTPAPPLDEEANPWLGLRAYTQNEADRYFGRGDISDRLLAKVMANPLVVVTGPSGIGKSSLILAGLLPRLSADHTAAILRPGPAPFAALAAALGAELRDATDVDGLARLVETRADAGTLVLVIDQAEELVTQQDERVRRHFLESIACALSRCPQRLKAVFSIRSDLEPQFVGSPLQALWPRGRFFVPPMRREELRRVVEGPAAVKVMRFESQELVDRLVDDVLQMPGALPLLSFALSEMYLRYLARAPGDRTLTSDDLERLGGGVAGALQVRANALVEQLDPSSRITARRVLERLVSIEGGEFTRRRVRESDFESCDDLETIRAKDVLKKLADARLVVADTIDGAAQMELAHDALIPGWALFHDWLRADAGLIADQRRLAQDAAAFEHEPARNASLLWDDAARIETIRRLEAAVAPGLNRSEALFAQASHGRASRNRRRFLAVVVGLIGLTVGALVAATLALTAQRLAEQRTLEARSQELASEAQLRTLGQQRGTPEEGLLLAAESLRLNPSVAGYNAYEDALKHLPTALASFQAAGGVRMARYVADRRAFLTVDDDRTASLQSLDGGPVSSFTLKQRITDAAYHVERGLLALASATEVAEFDVRSGATTWRRPFPSPVIALMYPKSGGNLAIVCADGSIFIHRERGEALVPIAPSGSDVSAVALSDDGAKLAYGSGRPPPDLVPGLDAPAALKGFQASITPRKGKLVIAGTESGKLEQEVQFESPPTALTFDKSGQRVAAGLDEGTVALVRVSDGAILRTFANLRRKVLAVAFVDDDRLVSTASSGVVTFWSTDSSQALVTLPHNGVVETLQVDAKRRRLVTLAADGVAYGWDLAAVSSAASARPDAIAFRFRGTGVRTAWLDDETGNVVLADNRDLLRLVTFDHPSIATEVHFGLSGINGALAAAPDPCCLAAAANVMNWLLHWPDGKEMQFWLGRSRDDGLPSLTVGMTFSADGRWILMADQNSVAMRNAADPKSIHILTQGVKAQDWMSISLANHGGSIVAATPNAIAGWRFKSDEATLNYLQPLTPVSAIVGNPRDDVVFVATDKVELRKASTGELLGAADIGARPIALNLSPRGDVLAAGLSGGGIVLLKAPFLHPFAHLEVQEDAIGAIDQSADGDYVASTSGSLQSAMTARRDQSLQITDLRKGVPILRLPMQGASAAIRFMADGSLAILDNGVLKRLDWRAEVLRTRACSYVGADLPSDALSSLKLQPVCHAASPAGG